MLHSSGTNCLVLLTISSLVLAVVVVRADTNNVSTSHYAAVIRSSCSITLYPDLCVSAVSAAPDLASKVKSPKDVIELSINLTITAVQHNYFTIEKLIAARSNSLTTREKTALHDCLDMIDETLDELHKSAKDLEEYSSFDKSISEHAEDLMTLLSAAMTNQDTCIDGFSHDHADKNVREALLAGQVHVYHMCSNLLAMIKNLTHTDMAKLGTTRSSLDESYHGPTNNKFPKWMSIKDRKLLQATTVTPDVTVATDGSGNFITVAAAVAAAPEGSSRRYVIRIKSGVYRENVDVPKKKINLMFIGDGRKTTIITGNRNVVDGSTTFNSATVAVVGDRFLAKEITFQNTAGPSKHQAVALRVGSDLSAFYKCDMIAYQDTLYVHSLRQFFINCYVVGTVDFIFGNAVAVFQDCDIHARLPNPGQRNMLTAQGRDDPNQNTGIVIQKCRIGSTSDLLAAQGSVETYLGRPWKAYSRTVVMQSSISDVIEPVGWYPWPAMTWFSTVYYGEYQNLGTGASTSSRVTWPGVKVITSASVAQGFTPGSFIGGANWLGSTGFPYSLGL